MFVFICYSKHFLKNVHMTVLCTGPSLSDNIKHVLLFTFSKNKLISYRLSDFDPSISLHYNCTSSSTVDSNVYGWFVGVFFIQKYIVIYGHKSLRDWPFNILPGDGVRKIWLASWKKNTTPFAHANNLSTPLSKLNYSPTPPPFKLIFYFNSFCRVTGLFWYLFNKCLPVS